LAILSGFACRASDDLKLNAVVIDAGHGGKDPGAVSADRQYFEKDFTLDISKKLAEKIKSGCPGVKVVQTRTTDVFVSLGDRAAIANRANAKLFISIHINASTNHDASGYSAHVLGQSSVKDRDLFAYNMNICQRENSVILLEDDYSTKYQGFDPNDQESYIFMTLMQNANLEQSLLFAQTVADQMAAGPIPCSRGVWQNPFYVLWKTSMPAVLLELGFISNRGDLEIIKNDIDKIVDNIYLAFVKYKGIYDESFTNTQPAEPQVVENKVSDIKYGVQIFAGKTLLKENDKSFMGYTPEIIKTGDIYKYVIGVSDELEKAKENYLKIKQKYPNSFIIKMEKGRISLVQ